LYAGVGTAGLAGLHGEMDEEEAVNAIEFAIECGVNFIDTAPYYNDRQLVINLYIILCYVCIQRSLKVGLV